jgi:hypothetical protein
VSEERGGGNCSIRDQVVMGKGTGVAVTNFRICRPVDGIVYKGKLLESN